MRLLLILVAILIPASAVAGEWKTFEKPNKKAIQKLVDDKKITKLQYDVTQKDDTEPPFRNTYWDNKKAGIYVDVISGEPLFSSIDKYVSGTGWPSFTRALLDDNVVQKTDYKLIFPRTELRSKRGDSHLGHVFNDGPAPTGKRFCINSAALRFVPVEDLETEGYGEFKAAFEMPAKEKPKK